MFIDKKFIPIIQKKIILFGRGILAAKILSKKNLRGYVDFIVDNNLSLQGTKYLSKEIKPPKILSRLDKKEYFVIICSTSFNDISHQLKSFKFKNKHNFAILAELKNYDASEKLNNLKKVFLISSGLPKSPISNGGLFEVNLNKLKVKVRKVYNGCVHGIKKVNDGFLISDSGNGLVKLDKKYKVKKNYKFDEDIRLHGIAHDYKNDLFYIANTNQDSIYCLDNNLKLKNKIYLSNKFNKFNKLKRYQHHINDILFYDNKLYCSMFSLKGNFNRGTYDGGVMSINLKNNKKKRNIFNNLKMPHSIKRFKNKFYIIDSLRGELISSKKNIVKFEGFIRGLDIDDDYIYLGKSKNRNFIIKNLKNINKSIDSGIIIFHQGTEFYKIIQLTQFNVNEIHEVVCIK